MKQMQEHRWFDSFWFVAKFEVTLPVVKEMCLTFFTSTKITRILLILQGLFLFFPEIQFLYAWINFLMLQNYSKAIELDDKIIHYVGHIT
jgi:hypothetical protein